MENLAEILEGKLATLIANATISADDILMPPGEEPTIGNSLSHAQTVADIVSGEEINTSAIQTRLENLKGTPVSGGLVNSGDLQQQPRQSTPETIGIPAWLRTDLAWQRDEAIADLRRLNDGPGFNPPRSRMETTSAAAPLGVQSGLAMLLVMDEAGDVLLFKVVHDEGDSSTWRPIVAHPKDSRMEDVQAVTQSANCIPGIVVHPESIQSLCLCNAEPFYIRAYVGSSRGRPGSNTDGWIMNSRGNRVRAVYLDPMQVLTSPDFSVSECMREALQALCGKLEQKMALFRPQRVLQTILPGQTDEGDDVIIRGILQDDDHNILVQNANGIWINPGGRKLPPRADGDQSLETDEQTLVRVFKDQVSLMVIPGSLRFRHYSEEGGRSFSVSVTALPGVHNNGEVVEATTSLAFFSPLSLLGSTLINLATRDAIKCVIHESMRRDTLGDHAVQDSSSIAMEDVDDVPPPPPSVEIWTPSQSSVLKRAQAATVKVSLSCTAKPPTNFSDSPFLAASMGHALRSLRDNPPTGPFMPSLPRHPPPPPCAAEWRPLADQVPTYTGPLFEREYALPLPADFEWPPITHYAFYEDRGCIREAHRSLGYISCSVADRPTCFPPSEGCYHFIGQVYDFVQAVAKAGLTIVRQSSHVECGRASWSAYALWPENLLNGSLKEAGEELLWIMSIGCSAFGEQPHTAHETTLGRPTLVANANEHGGNDKTWCIWSRFAGYLTPSDIVPLDKRRSILASASGSREQRMMKRSRTGMPMAIAIAKSMNDTDIPAHETGRPANQPCSGYTQWRAAFHHNINILASSYAPVLTANQLLNQGGTRTAPCAVIIPIAPSAFGPRFFIPLQDAATFGIVLNNEENFKKQVEDAAKFLSMGIETHYMHGLNNETHDFIVAVPCDRAPVVCVSNPSEVAAAAASRMPSAWCTQDALAGHPAFNAASYAVQRMAAMGNPASRDELNVGIWNKARPALLRQRAKAFREAPELPEALQQ